MELTDKDLASIQQVRKLLSNAHEAKQEMKKLSQDQIDNIIKAISQAATDNAEHLAKLAVEETGFGNVKDKTVKNLFASKTVYNAIKDMKTVGMIACDEKNKVIQALKLYYYDTKRNLHQHHVRELQNHISLTND